MQNVKSFSYAVDSSEKFSELLTPAVGGELHVRPLKKTSSKWHIHLFHQRQLAIFTVRCKTSYSVSARGHRSILGLTIPAKGGFEANINSLAVTFTGHKAHVLSPHEEFQFQQQSNNSVLVCNIREKVVIDRMQRLNQKAIRSPDQNMEVNLAYGYGLSLHRLLNYFYAEVQQNGPLLHNELFSQELEESVISAYSLALSDQHGEQKPATSYHSVPQAVRKVEEYISAHLLTPLSLAELADVAGIPARTLIRLFNRHHRASPVQFMRLRRYEAARTELNNSNRGETTVLEIATKYGFSCAGRFAKEYHKLFHELPSVTLRRESRG